MGTATGYDPVVEHEKTRAALGAATPRLERLLRDAADPAAPSGVAPWTVGDVGAHLAAVYVAYCSAVAADGAVAWDGILPSDDLPFAERIAAVNAKAVGLFGAEGGARPVDLVAEQGERFLRTTEGLAPDTPVAAPWYGPGFAVPLSVLTGLLLNETLLHGLDIARGAKLPWTIDPHDARLVLGQAMPTMMPLVLDTAKARGVRIAFDLAIEGGPRLAVVVDGGEMTVARDAPPRSYDCRITADPTAFLLVAFRRMPTWKAVTRGRLRAGGRKPWLASRLSSLITPP
ncbi:maleylpyruvate isomerase family mycothiol-dependent enzyme [Kitasatospora sp. NPDC054939]